MLSAIGDLWRYHPEKIATSLYISRSAGFYLGATFIYGAVQSTLTEVPKRLRSLRRC